MQISVFQYSVQGYKFYWAVSLQLGVSDSAELKWCAPARIWIGLMEIIWTGLPNRCVGYSILNSHELCSNLYDYSSCTTLCYTTVCVSMMSNRKIQKMCVHSFCSHGDDNSLNSLIKEQEALLSVTLCGSTVTRCVRYLKDEAWMVCVFIATPQQN